MTEDFDLAPHLEAVTAAVQEAGALSLQWYRRLDQVENKASSGFDPVTEADRAVERSLRQRLADMFPDHAILGEEFGLSGESRYRWTIDPIDGTRAFIVGQPMWGTLLGFQIDDVPVAGWMHMPVLNETYVGFGGCRMIAESETRNISVGTTTELSEAIVATTHPDMFETGAQADAYSRLAAAVKMVRYSGDCLNYGQLAMGLVDLVVENQLAPYDIIPLIPIVEEAGGVITNLDGGTPIEGGYVVAAATPGLHSAALAMLTSS